MSLPQNYPIYENRKASWGTIISRWIAESWRPTLAEFFCNFLLTFFGCMGCIPLQQGVENPPMFSPFVFGVIVIFNIQIFGHISGAYMNPCISIVGAIFGQLSIPLTIAYCIAEFAGAILGYGFLIAVTPYDMVGEQICHTIPNPEMTVLQAVAVEMVLTAVLSLINCANFDPRADFKSDSVGLRFGLTVAGLSVAGTVATGTSMNPSRSLGPAVWAGNFIHYAYWVGPLVGSIIPALFYKYVWLPKPEDTKKIEDEGKQ